MGVFVVMDKLIKKQSFFVSKNIMKTYFYVEKYNSFLFNIGNFTRQTQNISIASLRGIMNNFGKVEEDVRISGVQQMLTSFRLGIKHTITVKLTNVSEKKTILNEVQSSTVDLVVKKTRDKMEQRETRLALSTITNIILGLVLVTLNDRKTYQQSHHQSYHIDHASCPM